MCSELATIVTTQENSLLVWGSRPCVKSPLHVLLSDHAPSFHLLPDDKARTAVNKRQESDVSLSPVKQVFPVTFDIGSPDPPSPPDVVPLPNHSGSRDKVHRSSSLNLTNTPHQMTVCTRANLYMKTLTQLLVESNHVRVGRGDGRRGPSVSSEGGGLSGGLVGADKEGVILEPTSVDLVGRCGLLADLSAQGLQHAKLECVSSFAGNLLILIEAKVPEEKEEGQRSLKVSPPKPQLLMMSKRLIERRHWKRLL